MFGMDSGELFIIVLVAVVVIGPKDLPRVMRTIGHWVGKARGMANQFRSGVDQMVRESELEDLEKKWREQNEAIMRAHPNAKPDSDWGQPAPPPIAPPETAAAPSAPEPAGGRREPPALAPPLVKPAQPEPRPAAGGTDLP